MSKMQAVAKMVRDGSKDKTSSARLREIIRTYRKNDIQSGITPEKLVNMLEDLGPTFIKLGQIMSSRTDMLPHEYCDALAKLRSNTEPEPFDVVEERLNSVYDGDYTTVFSSIDPTPLGSASIAQVHEAVLRENGHKVAVKIRRRNVREDILRDLQLMRRAADVLDVTGVPVFGNVLRSVDLNAIIGEFERVVKDEIDFRVELENLQRFSHSAAMGTGVSSPRVYPEYCSEKVLVMEFIEGVSLEHVDTLREMGYDLADIGNRIANSYMRQMIEEGFYHADPHAANIIIRPAHLAHEHDEEAEQALADVLAEEAEAYRSVTGKMVEATANVASGMADSFAKAADVMAETMQAGVGSPAYRARTEGAETTEGSEGEAAEETTAEAAETPVANAAASETEGAETLAAAASGDATATASDAEAVAEGTETLAAAASETVSAETSAVDTAATPDGSSDTVDESAATAADMEKAEGGEEVLAPGEEKKHAEGEVVWIDCGMMGRLTPYERTTFLKMMKAMVNGDVHELTDLFIEWGSVSDEPGERLNYGKLLTDLEHLIDRYSAEDADSMDIAQLLSDLMGILESARIKMPESFVTLVRGLASLQATLITLTPEISIMKVVRRYVRRHLTTSFDPVQVAEETAVASAQAARKSTELPGRIANVLDMFEKGRVKVGMDFTDATGPLEQLQFIIDQMSLSTITAGLFIGSSMLYAMGVQPTLFGIPVIGFLGYMGALCLSIYIVYNMRRNPWRTRIRLNRNNRRR
jgi:predicted unusual protein kinase regulating ubiquinone biosynthesis (AarF/ABC1/UbiB family)